MAIELGSAYGKVILDAQGVRKGSREAQDALSQLDKTVQDVFSFSMGNLAAQGIGKLIGGLSDLYGETRALATGFESQMAIMSTAVDPATASMDTLHEAAIGVGDDISLIGIDASQAAGSMTDLFRSGKDVTDVFGDLEGYMAGTAQLGGILRASVDLQAASMLDLGGATTLVNSTLATYGLAASDAVDVTDNFVKTADASQAEVHDLAEAHKNAAIVLASFGYTVEDTNTALALLSENALKGAEAGTSLRAMVNNMLRPTKKTADAWRELNVSLYDSEGQLKRLPDIIGEMVPALQNVTTERRNELAYILAGADGQRALNILLSNGAGGWREMEQAIAGASTAQEVAAARAATLAGAQEQLEGQLETLKIQVGEEFIPMWTRMTQGLTAFYDEHGPQIVAAAGKIADAVMTVMDALENADPVLVRSAVHLAGLTMLAGGGYTAFVKLGPVVSALGPALSQLATGLAKGSVIFKAAEGASLGLGATLGTLAIGLGAVVLAVVALNTAIEFGKDIYKQTEEVGDAWSNKLTDIAGSTVSAQQAANRYVEAQNRVNQVLDDSNPIAAAFIDRQKVGNVSTGELQSLLVATANSYEDYHAAVQRVNEAVRAQATSTNWAGVEVVNTQMLMENSLSAMGEVEFAARRGTAATLDSAQAFEQYSAALRQGEQSMDDARTAAGLLLDEQEAAAAKVEEMAALYDTLSTALSNTGLSQSVMTRRQGELAAQMGYTTRLANMQGSAMDLLAFEHAQGRLSLEQYIAAGQQVQAVHEDSIGGYQAVMGAVQSATQQYWGMSAATADLPGAMQDVAAAALESAAAQEEMAKRAAEAWTTFTGNVQTGVAGALEAYKAGNAEMLAEQQRALGEMLLAQTNQMLGMGQITKDQANEMKVALSDEFGIDILVNDVQLATDRLLELFSSWASGGKTSADDVVSFIQNIGTESATLKSNAEADIQAQLTAWETLKTDTGTASTDIIGKMGEMGIAFADESSTIEGALGAAGAAAGTMSSDVEGAAGRAVTAIGSIGNAIETLPEYKKIEIEVVKTGDEAFDFGSPQFRFFYALENLVDYAQAHPVEIDVASRMDGGMALGAPLMAAAGPVAAPTGMWGSGAAYDQRKYEVNMPVTAVQDALDIERLAMRVVALIRGRQ